MGQGASGASSSSTGKLGKEQRQILVQREQQYQRYFFPQLIGELQKVGGDVPQLAAQAQQGMGQAFGSAQRNLQSSMAQRGLTGSGFEAAAMSGLGQARSQAMADAMMKARTESNQRQLQLLQMGGAMSPQPTSSVPVMGKSEEGKPWSLWNFFGL